MGYRLDSKALSADVTVFHLSVWMQSELSLGDPLGSLARQPHNHIVVVMIIMGFLTYEGEHPNGSQQWRPKIHGSCEYYFA